MSKPVIGIHKIREFEARLNTVISGLQHQGEAGKNIESVVRELLLEYLPGKFGIETGFVRSLQNPNWESHQTDLLFTHKVAAHPLAVFPGSKVFPLETIIGFMEVTKRLSRSKLFEDFKKISPLKHMDNRYYIIPTNRAREFGFLPKLNNPSPEELLRDRISRVKINISDLQPRFFYFAFTSTWHKPISICKNLAEAGRKHDIHLHGMLVLDSGYYKHTPRASDSTPYGVSFINKMPNAFIVFIHDLIDSLQTFSEPPPGASIPVVDYGVIRENYNKFQYD